MNYVENRIKFKDGNVVVFINKDKKNHLLVRPGQTLTLDNLGTPGNQKIVLRELKITYPTWLKKIHMTSKEETAGQNWGYINAINIVEPTHQIQLTNHVGKKAIIDFNGDAVVYSGDLPVEESAQIFFEHVGGLIVAAVLEELRKMAPKSLEDYIKQHFPDAIDMDSKKK